MQNRNRGAALIMALLVVALVSAIALALMSQLQIDIQRSELSFDADQAYLAAGGVADWAILEYDQIVANQKLQLPPPRWPVVMPTQTTSNGTINGNLTSAQGRFNINNLGNNNSPGKGVPIEPGTQLLFAHLIQYVQPNISGEQASQLAANIARWLEVGNNPVYLQKQPPYRQASVLMASSSELRLVDGFSADLVDKLSPYITALPTTGTSIDVNAAPKGLLIAAGLSEAGADAVINYVKNNGNFTNLDGFYAISQFNGAGTAGGNQPLFTVNSNYYYASANIQFGKVYFTAYYLLQYKQPNMPLQVIGYSQGSL